MRQLCLYVCLYVCVCVQTCAYAQWVVAHTYHALEPVASLCARAQVRVCVCVCSKYQGKTLVAAVFKELAARPRKSAAATLAGDKGVSFGGEQHGGASSLEVSKT